MESGTGDVSSTKNLLMVLLYEFIGTAIMTYSFFFSAGNELSRALGYFISFLLAANISGAHFNPATSLGVLIFEGKISQ